MAIKVAEITVDFTATVDGCHRCAVRVQGSGDPYDTSNEVICPGLGACQIIVQQMVNTTSCDGAVTFEGYIQPCCEDVTSAAHQTPWTIVYNPTVVCERYEITIDEGNLTGVEIKNPGYGYEAANGGTGGRQPGDTFVSPGDDCTYDFTTGGDLGDGIINSITSLINPGTAYIIGDTIDVVQTGHVGITCVIRVDSVVGAGEIDTYSISIAGDEYSNQTANPFSYVTSAGVGFGADFGIISIQDDGADYDEYGAILAITIVAAGRYSIQPIIPILTGTGVDGDIEFRLTPPSGPFAGVGNDCAVNPVTVNLGLSDVPYAVCLDGGIGAQANYITTQTGCCINDDTTATACTTVTIENTTDSALNCQITECGGTVSTVSIAGLATDTYCLVLDGVNTLSQKQLTVTDTGISCT